MNACIEITTISLQEVGERALLTSLRDCAVVYASRNPKVCIINFSGICCVQVNGCVGITAISIQAAGARTAYIMELSRLCSGSCMAKSKNNRM